MGMGEKMRIYVGGLGAGVEEGDLKKTFTSPQLGSVQSIEIIRTKGRSFAYLDFLPASDKALAKLFSTYNGCLWKGGKLKLEKAKEHYIFRLRREWAEDAQVEFKSSSQNVAQVEVISSSQNFDEGKSKHAMQKLKRDQDIDKMQLKIFFPKLRKIKPIPFKGTGRHKYSFQRVEIPPLPIHFCDCEEHFGPPEPAKNNCSDDHETNNYGVNEDELNMMKSVLDKLLENETCSVTVSNEAELSEEINYDTALADKRHVDDNEEDQVSDEDNLVINMVGQQSKRVTLFEDWGLKTTAANQVLLKGANQDSSVREPESFSNSMSKVHGTKKEKNILDKKRKPTIQADKSNDTVASGKKGRKGAPHDSINNPVVVKNKPIHKESGSTQLSCDVASSKKSTWRALVSEQGSATFNISDILPGLKCEAETEPRSDLLATASYVNENDRQQDQSSKYQELEKLYDVRPTKPTASDDTSARGTSWLQKSSWLQLVSDARTNTFNLAQILPEATFEKKELQQSRDADFSNLRSGKQQGFVNDGQKSPIENVDEPQGRDEKNLYDTPNPSVNVLTKGQNHGVVDAGQLSCDPKGTAVKEEEASAPTPGAKMVPNNRALGHIVISETCPFMRSAASMKEWVKSKAALSGSHKKKG